MPPSKPQKGRKPVGLVGGYVGVLACQPAVGTTFNTFTTAKSVITLPLIGLPPNFFYIGKTLRITVTGALGNLVTTPGTITFQCMVGAVIAFTTGAIQLNATSHTALPFWLDILLTCRAVGTGTTAKLMGMGRLQGIQPTLTAAQVDAVNTGGIFSAPATAPTLGTGFDSTLPQTLDFFVGFSISDLTNSITVHNYLVEDLN